MSDEDVKQAHWRQLRRLTFGMVLLIVAATIVLPLAMPQLNAYRFLRFPLGYFLAADAAVVLLAGLVYGFFSSQERNDRVYNMTIQF